MFKLREIYQEISSMDEFQDLPEAQRSAIFAQVQKLSEQEREITFGESCSTVGEFLFLMDVLTLFKKPKIHKWIKVAKNMGMKTGIEKKSYQGLKCVKQLG